MAVNGLSIKAKQIFEDISRLQCIKEYCLIGGTALALQIEHRLSEDLDFCIWKKAGQKRPEVKWAVIFNELSAIGKVEKNIFDLSHCDFHVNSVKVTFFCNNIKEPENLQRIAILNNIAAADPVSIGVMKLEVLQYRTTHRDYYDIYSLLQEGVSLETLITRARKYLRHNLRTREILSLLTNRTEINIDKRFADLLPKYDVSLEEIKLFFVEKIQEMQKPDNHNTV